MKNIVLILNVMLLVMTLSIVILPQVWMITVVGGADGPTGVAFPPVWMIYGVLAFVSSGFTISWLIRK
jgi:hypothetical protein